MKPEASPAALELFEALEPLIGRAEEENDWLGLRMAMAMVAGRIDLLHSYLIDDVTNLPAWSVIFDPERAPEEALPYLAQFSGAVLTPDMDEAARRKAIQSPEAFGRGRLSHMESVAKRRLTGTKSVLIEERVGGNAWRIRVTTIEAETPEPEVTEAEIIAEAKPVGTILFFNRAIPWNWGEAKESLEFPTWGDVKEAFPTWQAYRVYEP